MKTQETHEDEMKMVELQAGGRYGETGTIGLEAWGNAISEAYTAELKWPDVAPLYNRIWRSDPEATLMRNILDAWSNALTVSTRIPEEQNDKLGEPTDDDKKANDFLDEVLRDIDGGIEKWLVSCMTRVPFYGWGWWEAPLGVRNPDWKPPGKDEWRSGYDDGLLGYRRLAFRRYTSMWGWEIDQDTGRLDGLIQLDLPNEPVTIPLDKSLHCTFGDSDNPEGLATLEALWRLERIKYGFEFTQGVGFEHAAGHLAVDIETGKADEDAIRKAARNILTAQEGNYAVWPEGTKGEIIDVPFAAADSLMDAIRYYGLLKMALLGYQFVGIASISGTGSYAAMSDASAIAVSIFNSMARGFVKQADQQIVKRLFDYPINQQAFPNMTRRPEMIVDKLEKEIDLTDLGAFISAISTLMPLGESDLIAVRKKSGILPEELPEEEIVVPEPKVEPKEKPDDSVTPSGEPDEKDEMELKVRRPLVPGKDEKAIITIDRAIITENDIRRAVKKFHKWAKENEPSIDGILNAKVVHDANDPRFKD